jgi:glycogen debranching enzyme
MSVQSNQANQSFSPINPFEDIKQVETPFGFNASNSVLYAMAEFGRDARQLAVDALTFNPEITKKVIFSLVRRQAFKRNDITEAQPGKFHHEHRQRDIAGQIIPEANQKILVELAAKWGGTHEKVTYYGSYDITPDAVSLIADATRIYQNLLDEKIHNEEKKKPISIRESAKQGLTWVEERIAFGPTKAQQNSFVEQFLLSNHLANYLPAYHHNVVRHLDWFNERFVEPVRIVLPKKKQKRRIKLFEFLRTNKQGLTYQGWMDGGTSFMHAAPGIEGILANHRMPMATIEMQASAIDSLEKGASIFPKKAKRYKKLAEELRTNVLTKFWMPEDHYFAMGIDRDLEGNYRQITTWGANVGEILNSTMFDGLSMREQELYISAIIKKLFSSEFLTDAGIRTRAKKFAYLSDLSENRNAPNSQFDYWDYQGSETSWFVQTGRIAEGLRKQGFYALAEALDNRILYGVTASGCNLEYVYVGARGKLENVIGYTMISKSEQITNHGNQIFAEINATNMPEATQTWTASRVAAILYRRKHAVIEQSQPVAWKTNLEKDILTTIPHIVSQVSAKEVTQSRNNGYVFVINQNQGRILESKIKEASYRYYQR